MLINKETMKQGAFSFLETLFRLPEIEKVSIKDIIIHAADDYDSINEGLALCYHDNLSDVDFNAWLRLSPEDYNGTTPIYKKYFKRLGIEDQIFGITFQERDNESGREGMRICLKTGFRMDFTCFTRCDKDAKTLPKSDLRVDIKVKQQQNIWNDWDLDKANSFWFISIQALSKLLRHDYLISDHLTHMLIMEGLVLQMIDRDNQYQTNFHRYGYKEQLSYRNVDIMALEKYLSNHDDTYNHIVQNLCKAVLCYDNLVAELNPLYQKRSELFFNIWDSYLKIKYILLLYQLNILDMSFYVRKDY
jgi:hypothetical protein